MLQNGQQFIQSYQMQTCFRVLKFFFLFAGRRTGLMLEAFQTNGAGKYCSTMFL